MTTRNQTAKVYRGDSSSVVINVTHADGTEYDPTIGAQFFYRVARTSHADDGEAMVRKSVGNGIVSNGTGGVTVTLNPEDTDFPPGIYYHELKVVDAGDVATAMTGAFVIRNAVHVGARISPAAANRVLSAVAPTRAP